MHVKDSDSVYKLLQYAPNFAEWSIFLLQGHKLMINIWIFIFLEIIIF